MTFDLYTDAALARDLPEYSLRRGDLVKIVDAHTAGDGENGYSVEVFNALVPVDGAPGGGTSSISCRP